MLLELRPCSGDGFTTSSFRIALAIVLVSRGVYCGRLRPKPSMRSAAHIWQTGRDWSQFLGDDGTASIGGALPSTCDLEGATKRPRHGLKVIHYTISRHRSGAGTTRDQQQEGVGRALWHDAFRQFDEARSCQLLHPAERTAFGCSRGNRQPLGANQTDHVPCPLA